MYDTYNCMYMCYCLDFFAFGERNGDEVLEDLDKTVGPINLTVPLLFYRRKEHSLYVCENNNISYYS